MRRRVTRAINLATITISLLSYTSLTKAEVNCGNNSYSFSEQSIQKAYIAYYGRPADYAGLQYWSTQLGNEGGDLHTIIDAFGNSAEFDERFSFLGNEQRVDQIYLQLFNRSPEENGKSFWLDELNAERLSLQKMALEVLYAAANDDSDIISNKLQAANYITDCIEKSQYLYNSSTLNSFKNILANVSENPSSLDSAYSQLAELLGLNQQTQLLFTSQLTSGQEETVTTALGNTAIRASGTSEVSVDVNSATDSQGDPMLQFNLSGGSAEIELPESPSVSNSQESLVHLTPHKLTEYPVVHLKSQYQAWFASVFTPFQQVDAARLSGNRISHDSDLAQQSAVRIFAYYKNSSQLFSSCNDFSQCADKQKTPVLLIHGLEPESTIPLLSDNGGEGYWGQFPAKLIENGYLPYEFRWISHARLQDVTNELALAIESIYTETNQKKVHILAHSMGGPLIQTLLQIGPKTSSVTSNSIANMIDTVTTVGAPHSGLADSAKSMHQVDFPLGQDHYEVNYFSLAGGCQQISCQLMGQSLYDPYISNILGINHEPGEWAAKLYETQNELPSINLQVLIGLSASLKSNSSSSSLGTLSVANGDLFLSGNGQRFLPDLTASGSWSPLLSKATIGQAKVSEFILGRTSSKDTNNQTIQSLTPNQILEENVDSSLGLSTLNPGYVAYAHSGASNGFGRDFFHAHEVCLDCDGNESSYHDTLQRFLEWAADDFECPAGQTIITSANGSKSCIVISSGPSTPPTLAVDDSETLTEDDPATAITVLTNDTGAGITIDSVTQPPNGTVVITGGGTGLTYEPNGDYCNDGTPTDDFTYTLIPGSSTATVEMTVTCVNDPPVVVGSPKESFDTIGNTTLEYSSAPSLPPSIFVSGNLLSNFQADADGPFALSASLNSKSPNAVVTVNSNGTFVYTPPPGQTTADTFTYDVTDGGAAGTVTRTVTITPQQMVWYVKNDATGPGSGTSLVPFNQLSAAQAAAQASQTIFVHNGDNTTSGQNSGITLKTNQRLIGEGVALTFDALTLNGVGPATVTLVSAGTRAKIGNSGGDGISIEANATNGDLDAIEVRGLDISGSDNAISVSLANNNNAGITIDNNVVSAAGNEGILVSHNSTGKLTSLIQNNTLSTTGNAFDASTNNAGNMELAFKNNTDITSSNAAGTAIKIQDVAGSGTLFMTDFSGNTVSGTSAGNGIQLLGVVFDSDPADPDYDQVDGGNTNVGIVSDRVAGAGLVMGSGVSPVSGNIGFNTLNLYSFGDGALDITGSGISTGGSPPTAGLLVGITSGTIDGTNGHSANLRQMSSNIQLSNVSSSSSTTNAILLDSLAGSINISAGGLVNSTNATFAINGGSVSATYSGSIAQGSNAPAVSVTGGHSTGTITFNTGTISATSGTGLHFDNADGTYQFNGQTQLNGADAGIDILNGSGGTMTFSDTDITNPSGIGFRLDSSTASVTYTSVDGSLTNNSNHAVDINGMSGGSVIFNTPITETGSGIDLTNNTGATITFNQNLALDTTNNTAFNAGSGGTITLAGANNTFDTTGGLAVDLDNVTTNITLNTINSTNSTGRGIELTNLGANSSLTVTGTTTIDNATQQGIFIDGIGANSNLNFADANINNRNQTGIFINNHAGTKIDFADVNIPNPSNANGNGLEVTNSSGNMEFDSLDISNTNLLTARADGGADGIPDNTTDDGHGIKLLSNSGSFTITGTGTQGDGGSINNIKGDGIRLDNIGDLSINKVTIDNIGTSNSSPATVDNAAIYGINITGTYSITNSTISRFEDGLVAGTNSRGIHITNSNTNFTSFLVRDTQFSNTAGANPFGDDAILFTGIGAVNGTITVDSATATAGAVNNNSIFSNLSGQGVQVNMNGTGTVLVNIAKTTFRDAIPTSGFGGVNIAGIGTSHITATLDRNHFENLFDAGVNNGGMLTLFAGESASMTGTVSNSTFLDTQGRGAIRAATGDTGTDTVTDFDITIDSNTIDDTDREAISILLRGEALTGGGSSDIRIINNNLGQTTNVATSGREGIEIRCNGNSTAAKQMNLLLQNNTVQNFVNSSSDETVDIDAEDGCTLHANLFGNTLTSSGSISPNELEIHSEDANSEVCLNMNSDNMGANRNTVGTSLITLSAGTFNIHNIGGPSNSTDVDTFISARNDGSYTVSGASFGTATCSIP